MNAIETIPVPTATNFDRFHALLTTEYMWRFKADSRYAVSAARTTPQALAHIVTTQLQQGLGDKEGHAVEAVCLQLDIIRTYKAIRAFLAKE